MNAQVKTPPAEFQHRHAAHCESGVMSALLTHAGLPLSEPLAFGLGEALVFVHMPWVKLGGVPLTGYRMLPGTIIRRLAGNLGVEMEVRRYRRPEEGMRDLDRLLEARGAVGMQTSVYWLPYFPPDMRFHFNAHNLIAFGKRDGQYQISDPVFEHVVQCPPADLAKARFVRGPFAPRGTLYFPRRVPVEVDLRPVVLKAIKRTARRMVKAPIPIIGVRGIRLMARNIERLPRRHADLKYPRAFVGSVVRMQEEIGTGGGGFRFMFASFLQEAAALTGREELDRASEAMTAAGDTWREFALGGAKLCKRENVENFKELAELLRSCADQEEAVFRRLLKI